MKKIAHFEVVDQNIDCAWGEWYSTESEAREAIKQSRSEGDNYPVYIRKVTFTVNAKGKTINKTVQNMGLA